MGNILVLAAVVVVLLLGAAAYLGITFAAIIFWLGANDRPIIKRSIIGILGVIAIWLFVAAVIYLTKYGWTL